MGPVEGAHGERVIARAMPQTAAAIRRARDRGMLPWIVLTAPVWIVLALVVALGWWVLGCDPDDGEHGGPC